MSSNETEGVCYRQPRTLQERVAIAAEFAKRSGYEIPLVVDTFENRANGLYAGWPERFYIIDASGVIVYKGEPGPFGYHPEEVERWLAENLEGPSEPASSAPIAARLKQ
jgi:type I thyroxine 5'-deiodinase